MIIVFQNLKKKYLNFLVILFIFFILFLISIIPIDIKEYSFQILFIQSDKLYHFLVYFIASSLVRSLSHEFNLKFAINIFLFSVILELLQKYVGREFSLYDIFSNFMGIFFFYFLNKVFNKILFYKKKI